MKTETNRRQFEATHSHEDRDDTKYHAFLDAVAKRLRDFEAKGAIFVSAHLGFWEAFLAAIPESHRQHYTCNTCRHWFAKYAGLVALTDEGAPISAVFPEYEDSFPEELAGAIMNVRSIAAKASISTVFISDSAALGTSVAGGFRHMFARTSKINTSKLKTAGQRMAAFREDHKNLTRAIGEFKLEHLQDALRVLGTDEIARANKFTAHVEWLLELKKCVTNKEGRFRTANHIWRDVATAPTGWCSPRSQMVGTLLSDLAEGKSFEAVKGAWNAKMHPLQYQRPTAAPKAGSIAEAEKVFAALGLAPSLKRRFARLEEITALWRPSLKAEKKAPEGIFGSVKARNEPLGHKPIEIPAQHISWEKFQRNHLPTAQQISLSVPSHGDFIALLTAADFDAPPIIQWDREESRNPFSWYRYHGGCPASRFGLVPQWVEVTAITGNPATWNGSLTDSKDVLFILAGAHDTASGQGSALFPEVLRSELHGVRAVIEAYSRTNDLIGANEASACGIGFTGSALRVRTTDAHGIASEFILDRMD